VPIRIAAVEIVNSSKIETEEIAALVTTRPGDVLDGRRVVRLALAEPRRGRV
jgi:hypothetical protein